MVIGGRVVRHEEAVSRPAPAAHSQDACPANQVAGGGDDGEHLNGALIGGEVEKESMRDRPRRQGVRSKGHRADQAGVRQPQLAQVRLAVQWRGLLSVRRKANGGAGSRAGEHQVEGLIEMSAFGAEMNRFTNTGNGAAPIRAARRGSREVTKVALGIVTEGMIVALLGKFLGKAAGQQAGGIRRIEAEELSATGELEVGVKPLSTRRLATIFSRGEHDEILTRTEHLRPERPDPGKSRVIAQRPTGEIDGGRTTVVNLDPVLLLSIFILQTALVRGEDFVDDQISGRGIGIQ
jgi:hypothetical protein